MFGNFAAQAGVISFNALTSPNLISPTLNWNFNDVVVFDFSPPGLENINDRPRINIFRSVDGVPDFNYLQYISGGQKLLSPAPTGKILEPWGDRRTGQIRFTTTSVNNEIIAGIDLFTHPFALPTNISPPLNEWVIDSTSVPGEVKYQYQFILGQKNPQINIDLQYNPTCVSNGSVTLPNCSQNQYTVYLGTNFDGCPIYICENILSLIEQGSLYNINTWSGDGLAGFGKWSFFSGFESLRNISNSTQLGRQSIGSESFFIVGAREGPSANPHEIRFSLNTGLKSGESLSIDANYAWFDGSRIINFVGSNSLNQFRFLHINNDELKYSRASIVNGSDAISNLVITGNAFQKAFTYKVINLGTKFLIQVYQYGSQNILYSDIVTGNNINWDTFITGITCVATLAPFGTSTVENWFNYGMYVNNITYTTGEFNILPPSPSCFSNWQDLFSTSSIIGRISGHLSNAIRVATVGVCGANISFYGNLNQNPYSFIGGSGIGSNTIPFSSGELVTITNTTNYNGIYQVTSIDSTNNCGQNCPNSVYCSLVSLRCTGVINSVIFRPYISVIGDDIIDCTALPGNNSTIYYQGSLQISNRLFFDSGLSIPVSNNSWGTDILPTVVGPFTFTTYKTNNGVIYDTGSCTIILEG